MDPEKVRQIFAENYEKNNIALICRDSNSGQIQHIEIGKCHRRFSVGKFVPNFKCENKNNIHSCESIQQLSMPHIAP